MTASAPTPAPAIAAPWFVAFAARKRPPPDRLLDPTVGSEGDALRTRLATTEPAQLTPDAIRADLDGQLWMLTPEAFRYFLPGFMAASVAHYREVGHFVADLIRALTEPRREDVVAAHDRFAQFTPAQGGFPPAAVALLRQQQLEWFDSGQPREQFDARVADLTPEEGAAILAFLVAIRDAHGEDFPFDELPNAIDRRWGRYGGSPASQ